MNAATAENLMNIRAIDCESTGKQDPPFDRTVEVVEVEEADDSRLFAFIDFCMILLVYLGPVAAFGYLVAPVVVCLLSMPVPA